MSYQGLGEESYTEFKKRFYERIGDGTIFDCDGINLLKVVLDGLKVNYVQRGRYRNQLLLPAWKDRAMRIAKSFSNKSPDKKVVFGKTLIGVSARKITNENGDFVPVYFETIFRKEGRDNFIFVSEGNEKLANQLHSDFSIDSLLLDNASAALDAVMQQRRKALQLWFIEICSKTIFDSIELENIGYALDKFFREFVMWSHFLDKTKPKRVVLSCHYHQEGLIDAARRRNIEVVELQHGLISPEDIFFMFPQQVKGVIKRALFPDRVLVFGEFWRDRLLSGAESVFEKVEIGGYYLYQNSDPGPNKESVISYVNNRKVILITSQYSMHQHFLDFAVGLSKKLNDSWCIILKPHPNESPDLFAAINDGKNVLVTTANLDFLLSMSAIQVSVFSTTLFDGLRVGIMNFSLDIPQFGDYVNSMVKAGIANRLQVDENPIEQFEAKAGASTVLNSKKYYSDYNQTLFTGLIQ